MPGRHDALAPRRSRWLPTALDAVVAVTPTASLAAAFGLAGGGYLTGREDVAACGALAGAFGLIVERFATRGVRVRLRRERVRHRTDLSEVNRVLRELQRDLAGLRSDLDAVRSERDAVREQLLQTREALVPAQSLAVATAASAPAPMTVAGSAPAGLPAPRFQPAFAIVEEPVVAEPVLAPVATSEESAEAPAETPAEAPAPRVPVALLLPGQVRSPIATGGIPVLAPGASEPVRVIDLRSASPRAGADDDTQPVPVMTAALTDALVYAAMAEAEAAELSRTLHTGDAHHAGDYARELPAAGPASATLYVVRRGKHVA